MPQRPMKPGPVPDGFPALKEGARHVVVPSGVAATGWPAVRDTCAGFGVTFDPWQDGAGRVILAKRADGTYAASIGGVLLSIPRQVGKTFLIGAIVFALCLLHPGLTVLWTAHRLRTANETFSKMQSFARRKKVKPHVARIVLGSGDEEIRFHNGSRILFGARERGFGRGFDDVDVEVFDEAQILTENAVDDMVPAMNTAANPLPIFMGTPPKPTDPSQVFTEKRKAALSGQDPDVALVEFSADPDCDPDDRGQWRKANPSYPTRTPEASMLRMKKNLTGDSFVREGLGVWDGDGSDAVVDLVRWASLEDKPDARPSPVAFAVTASADRAWSYISVVGHRPDGLVQVWVAKAQRGTYWVVSELIAGVEKWKPTAVTIPADDPAASLIPDMNKHLKAHKLEVRVLNRSEYARACNLLVDGVDPSGDTEPTIRHGGGQLITMSLAAARWQKVGVGDLRAFAPPKDGSVCIAPLKGVAAAMYAMADAPQPKRRSGVVV